MSPDREHSSSYSNPARIVAVGLRRGRCRCTSPGQPVTWETGVRQRLAAALLESSPHETRVVMEGFLRNLGNCGY